MSGSLWQKYMLFKRRIECPVGEDHSGEVFLQIGRFGVVGADLGLFFERSPPWHFKTSILTDILSMIIQIHHLTKETV